MPERMVKRNAPYDLCDIVIRDASDKELEEISSSMALGLSLDEMKAVQQYYVKEGREATDVELQSLGQAWSEHCCYKSSKSTLKEFVFGLDRDDILSRGDAGVMVFDDDYGYALRVESHNHPSAIEPYGGAATGIGGIVRDVICMGAQPVGLVDPLCFGPIDRDVKVPKGIKDPKYLVKGVVSGIRDYGNRIGIPTVSGGFFFDDKYTGNCLVNVCCLGIVKRKDLLENYASEPGEVMILFGGRTGRDGIHGVNFASKDISSNSEEDSRGAVQLGDPITKEPVIHACIELAERHLVTGMKDLGGGGLSCVVGEMAIEKGCGADVDLDKVPLKESGLAPWEIWVSESQERMMCTCKPENVDKIMAIFDLWDIIATPVAKTTDTGHTRLFWNGEKIFDMDIQFLTGGPVYNRPYNMPVPLSKKDEEFPALPALRDVILGMLSDPNVASKEWAIRQYDHEVRASTVVHPMVGKMNATGPGDASVVKPVADRWKGLAVAVGCNPWFTEADPYRGGMASIDEAYRNRRSDAQRIHRLSQLRQSRESRQARGVQGGRARDRRHREGTEHPHTLRERQYVQPGTRRRTHPPHPHDRLLRSDRRLQEGRHRGYEEDRVLPVRRRRYKGRDGGIPALQEVRRKGRGRPRYRPQEAEGGLLQAPEGDVRGTGPQLS